MFTTGLILLILGLLLTPAIPPTKQGWETRDYFTTLPVFVGLVMCFLSAIIGLCRVLP